MTIDAHADVRRMIDDCDRWALGGRALTHIVLVAEALGTDPDFVEFMTPVCKYLCTEAGIRAADTAIQVMGGYGYLTEYGAAQNWRDARITSIYEGTNGIHARMTATRGITLNGGAGARAFARFLCDSGLGAEAEHWEREAEAMRAAPDPAAAHGFMERLCDLAFHAALARIRAVAAASPERERLLRLTDATRAREPALA